MAVNRQKLSEALDHSMAVSDRFGDDLNRLQADENGFRRLALALKSLAGIDLPLTPKNLSLLSSRMRKVLLAREMQNYDDYADRLEAGDQSYINEFVQAMTTNTTHFFRESEHFTHLKSVLPELMEAKRKAGSAHELRVWCAASSTGQEPYSILMTLLESGALPKGCELKFLATDIDLVVLEKAARAVYKEDDLEKVPPNLLAKYFDADVTPDGARWRRMKPQYASMIRFAPLNLIEDKWPFEKSFDIIFCRNVLIYFDSVTAQRTVERMAQQLVPNGLIYVGHSECGHVRTRTVKTLAAAAYQRPAA